MVDPTTTNKFLPQPTRGSNVNTWTAPYNNVFGIVDNSFGGTATIALTSAAVTLASSQYACAFLRFTGALTANVAVTLPAVGSFYSVINDTTNSSAFTITLLTTVSGGKQIGLPPKTTEIMTDGTDVRFRGLPFVGTYWNYSGSSVPAWVSACTVPPWLYCDGTTFLSSIYPALASALGGTTLPDLKGRGMAFYADGTGRISSASGGINGNSLFAAGGSQTQTLAQANLPNINFPVTDPGHSHTATSSQNMWTGTLTTAGGPGVGGLNATATITINSHVTGISVGSGGSGTPVASLPSAIVGGITMIRAA